MGQIAEVPLDRQYYMAYNIAVNNRKGGGSVVFQLNAPLLDGCVLAILEQGDAYGYSLTQRLKGEIDVSESTLYPVLRRLQKDGHLSVYDQQYQGRNRRYYTITPSGRSFLEDCRQEWADYAGRVERILSGRTEE